MAALVLVSLCAVGASAAQGSSANVQAPAVVGAPLGPGAPAACFDGTANTLDLFVRGADNHLYWKHSVDGGKNWGPSTDLGGILTSAPAVTSPSTGVMDVFGRGGDGAVWWDHYNATTSTWSGWSKPLGGSLGGLTPVNRAPAACSWGTGRLDVFVQGMDGALWQKSTTDGGKAWSSWHSLGGGLTSGPAATATVGNQIGVFVRGGDGAVWYTHYPSTSSGWDKWTSVGGQVYAGTSPAAYNWGSARIGWFVMGTDQRLYHNWKQWTAGGATNGWENLGGYLTSSPGTTARSNSVNLIDVFARGGDLDFSTLWQKSYDPGLYPKTLWSDWMDIGGV
jgi:hypothetical protein